MLPRVLLLLLLVAALEACASPPPAPAPGSSREFEIVYTAVLPEDLDPARGPVRIWVPLATDDGRQRVTVLERPAEARQGGPDTFGNRFAFLEIPVVEQESVDGAVERSFAGRRSFHWRYRVLRSVDHGGLESGDRRLDAETRRQLFLRPNRLVPVTGVAARMAEEAAGGFEDPFRVARALYDRVLEEMDYGKHGEGWGRGSTDWACREHYGNCTDFHALFISMARSLGLEARFQIGYSLPVEHGSGTLTGYHCWAHFFVPGHGWIPVDISKADQDPERAEFFFGHLDADRVAFSFGRDLLLDPAQQGEPLNFFVDAYAEQGGQPLAGLRTEVTWKDLE